MVGGFRVEAQPDDECDGIGEAGEREFSGGSCPRRAPNRAGRLEPLFSPRSARFVFSMQKDTAERHQGTAILGVLTSNGVRLLNAVQLLISGGALLGIKERHSRQREAVARAILDAARELFVAEGYHNVSIRKIAERSSTARPPSTATSQARTTSSSRLRKRASGFSSRRNRDAISGANRIRSRGFAGRSGGSTSSANSIRSISR